MKKWLALLLAAALMMMGMALAEGTLVAYFSHAGENYNVGVVEEGNTAKLAKVIAAQTGAELFEIAPVIDYPDTYDACLEAATAEQRTNARPAQMPCASAPMLFARQYATSAMQNATIT